MHSYKTLAVLVLAVTTAFPAFSAPVQEGEQQQTRANIDERDIRASTVDNEKRASAVGSLFGDLLKDSGSIGKVLGNGLLSDLASGAGAIGVTDLLNHTRREPLSLELAGDLSRILKAAKAADKIVGHPAGADGVANNHPSRDNVSLVDALRLLGRGLDELD